jgi:hypothetical protein
VDSIEVALEFAGQYLHARNIVGTRMYGGFIRMYSGDGRLGTTAEETFKVIENVSAEFIGESPGNFKYGIQLSGIGGFTIRNASFKWTDPDNTRGLLGDAVDFLPIELINSDSNFIENVRADFLQSSVPIRNAVRIANNSSNNYIKNVSCLNCNHVVDDATETSGSGNVIAYDAGESMFSTLVNYGTNELREWDQDKVRFIVTGGGEQGTIVNNFAYFNYVRGIPIIDEAKAPQFKNNSTGGPDYPIQVKVVNNGGNIPINRNGYMGILSQEGDFEYPPVMPADGETIIYNYLFNEATQKFELYDSPSFSYKTNPFENGNTVDQILDDLTDEVKSMVPVVKHLLDEPVMSNVEHAYGLRQLSSSYYGPLIEIERKSDSETLQVKANPATGRINQSEITSFCGASVCDVKTWYDQVGNKDATLFTGDPGRGLPEIYDGSQICKDSTGNLVIRFTHANDDALSISITSLASYVTRGRIRQSNGLFDTWIGDDGGTGAFLTVNTSSTPNVLYGNALGGFVIDAIYRNESTGETENLTWYQTYGDDDNSSVSLTDLIIGGSDNNEDNSADLDINLLLLSSTPDDLIDEKTLTTSIHYMDTNMEAIGVNRRNDANNVLGRLGVNTSLPTASLDVSGDARIRSTSRRDTLNKIAVFDDDGNLDHKLITSGVVTDTTDGSGDIVVAHGFGATPTIIDINTQGGGPLIPDIPAIDGTNFTVRFYDTSGAAVTSTSVTFSWSAQ